MPSNVELRWSPTEAERNVFKEWKGIAICFLVPRVEGCDVRSIQRLLEEHTGDKFPLKNMGFRTINEFLYAMQGCIEVRTLNRKLFVFIRESSVPVESVHIRNLVLKQTRTGVKRSKKHQMSYVRPEKLLEDVKFILKKPFNLSVVNPPGRSLKPCSVSSSSNIDKSRIVEKIATKTKNMQVTNSKSTSAPATAAKLPIIDTCATREIESKPEVTTTQPVNVALKENSARPLLPQTTRTEISLDDLSISCNTGLTRLNHMKGITLDTDDVLAQVVPMPTRQNQVVRMAMEMPKIKFPPFLRGGSQGHLSLKSYLEGINNV